MELELLDRSTVLLGHEGCTYALVGGDTSELQNTALMAIERGQRQGGQFHHYLFKIHQPEHDYLCEFCFPNNDTIMDKGQEPEWVARSSINSETPGRYIEGPKRGLEVTEVSWDYVPRAESTCTCPDFNSTCEAPLHLVRVVSGLVQDNMAVFARVPEGFRQGVTVPCRQDLYFIDMPPPPTEPLEGPSSFIGWQNPRTRP